MNTGLPVTHLFRTIICALALFAASVVVAAPSESAPPSADAIVGVWLVAEKDATIEIYRHNDRYSGKIAWLREEPGSARPEKNAMFETPRVGLVILRDFTFDGRQWKGGTLYDPTDGRVYRGVIRLDDKDTLYVRGFIGFSLIGRTTVWQRVR